MTTKERPIDWLPADKDDVERAQALAARPPEELVPVLPQLIRWLRYDGYPVAAPVAGRLRAVGALAVPTVRYVLRGHDAVLKRNVIRDVVSAWPAEDVAAVLIELGQLMSDSQSWGADLEALGVLIRHSLIDKDVASQWIAFKRARYREFSTQLEEIARMLDE